MKKKNTPSISICIPAYNGERYIGETLASIEAQKVSGVEIVIADDSTTDETHKVVSDFMRGNPSQAVLYQKNPTTLGFDKNVQHIVSLASADFCWLLGQDDKLLPGSIAKVLQVIKKNSGLTLIHSNYTRYDNNLKKITASKMISLEEDILFSSAEEFLFKSIDNSYFDSLGTNVITMSTDIVNRKKWLKAARLSKNHVGHNFIHCFTIAKMIKDDPKIFYIGKPQVWYRSKNERVWPNDVWKDYNEVFIDYLINLGYDKNKALKIRRKQKKYEKREALMKHKILKFIYPYASPLLGIYRMIKSRLTELI